jgi:hypothetical protein
VNAIDNLEIIEGIGRFRPRGECSLVEAVDLITHAIAYCRQRSVNKLLVNATGLVGLPIPSLVDRFLMVEMWAQEAKGMVAVVMVIPPEYVHPQKFGVKVAADFGLVADVHTSEADAFKWLARGTDLV